MPRYRLDIEYDGTPYAGWQRQTGQHSVQAAIEQAVLGFCGETVSLRGAGRTDAGVHAAGQVAHLDLAKDWPDETVRDAVNAHLRMAGEAVSVTAATKVLRRVRRALLGDRAALSLPHPQPARAAGAGKEQGMVGAGSARCARPCTRPRRQLVGRHDFTTFRSIHCQAKSPLRTLDRLDVTRSGDLIEIRASARSFLHNQVRSMVGTLKRVGEGAWSAADVKAALEARDRAACGAVAPPEGLYLIKVDYPAGA